MGIKHWVPRSRSVRAGLGLPGAKREVNMGAPASEITVDGRGDERGRTKGESLERSPSRPVGQFS
jgi:hypothetical protein